MTILRHDDNNVQRRTLEILKSQDCILEGEAMTRRGRDNEAFKSGEGGTDQRVSSPLATWSIFHLVAKPRPSQLYKGPVLKGKRQFLSGWLPKLTAVSAVMCANSMAAHASPIHGSKDTSTSTKQHRFYPRAVSQSTWIPIVAVCGFAFVLTALTCWRRRKFLAGFLRNRIIVANSSAGTRELTAEQLAGSINTAGTGDQSSNNATRPRRSRRPRRTPSQISTHSLPAYAKEPGEQELVVLQGPPDMEDAPISQPLATVIDLGEDADTSAESRPQSRYTSVPEVSPHSPLLEEDPVNDSSSSEQHANSLRNSGSINTGNDSADTSSLARVDSNNPASVIDPRGEAPPYFEVVEQFEVTGGVRRGFIDAGPHNTPASPILAAAPSPPSSPQPTSPRRSGFRSLLNRMSVSGTSHTRNESSASAISSSPSHSHSHSHTRGFSATSILSPFRPLSRQKSIASHNSSRPNLTSPSLISLNSISAPLTHTAVRTEIAYPRTGPTADQMRLIASRESFARFGVPYGADALAFASLSRDNLASGERPPEFDDAVGGGSGAGGDDASASSATGPSDRRSSEGSRPQEAPVNETSQNMAGGSPATSTSLDGLPVEQRADAAGIEGVPVSHSVLDPSDVVGADEKDEKEKDDEKQSKDKGKSKEVVEQDEQSRTIYGLGQEAQSALAAGNSATPEEGSASPKVTSVDSPEPKSVQVVPATPISRPVTPSTSNHQEPATTDTSPSGASPPATRTLAAPPSSYHPPSHLHPQDERPESRASQLSYASYNSYASDVTFRTAAESLSSRKGVRWPNTSEDEDDGDEAGNYHDSHDDSDDADTAEGEVERPLTPTLGGRLITRHDRESTDATVTGPSFSTTPRATRLKQEKHMSNATITHA